MRIAMISCEKYSDTHLPFIKLLDYFWPWHPPVTMITDAANEDAIRDRYDMGYHRVFVYDSQSWCAILARFAEYCMKRPTEPTLLMQDDFFINAPLRADLIARGLEQMEAMNAGCVRLYPCPGGEEDYGNPYYAIVPRGTRYRVSCQAALWNASYLHRIASQCTTPADFEIKGTLLSDALSEPVIAFKRNVQPWPIQYLCSAIGRGMWSQDAKRLCDSLNIDVDWSRRPFQAA